MPTFFVKVIFLRKNYTFMQLTGNFSHDAKTQDSQRAAAAGLRPQRPKGHCEDQEEAQG